MTHIVTDFEYLRIECKAYGCRVLLSSAS